MANGCDVDDDDEASVAEGETVLERLVPCCECVWEGDVE